MGHRWKRHLLLPARQLRVCCQQFLLKSNVLQKLTWVDCSACGKKHSDNDLIVAIDIHYYGYNTGVVSPYCGKKVRIVNVDNGKTVEALIAGMFLIV